MRRPIGIKQFYLVDQSIFTKITQLVHHYKLFKHIGISHGIYKFNRKWNEIYATSYRD